MKKQKYALVTGGTRGIGFATAALLQSEGYLVTAAYSHEGEDAARAREALPSVRFLRADVTDEEAVKELIEGMERLDLLVCNAGVASFAQVQDIGLSEWERVMRVNAGGVFLCCKHAVKKMLHIGEGGAIVNVSSIWGETGGSCESAYSASKGAVIAFTKALAKELAPSKITVNCVAPGVVHTSMNARFTSEELRAMDDERALHKRGAACDGGGHPRGQDGGARRDRARHPLFGERALHHGADPRGQWGSAHLKAQRKLHI